MLHKCKREKENSNYARIPMLKRWICQMFPTIFMVLSISSLPRSLWSELLPRIGFEICNISFEAKSEIERYEIQHASRKQSDCIFNDGS